MNIKQMPNAHFPEDVFEDYAFDRLAEVEKVRFEEHLLYCNPCREMLIKTDDYILVMKAATAAYSRTGLRTASPRHRSHGLRRSAAAAAVLLLTCLSALLSWRNSPDTRTVTLEAYRGPGISAPAGHPLDLKIDLNDVKQASAYRVEVVDSTGRRIWFGGTPAHLSKGLARGAYWVRLFTESGELLREFGIDAK